jgi:uncharacterized protein YodC (DUF2158 family)
VTEHPVSVPTRVFKAGDIVRLKSGGPPMTIAFGSDQVEEGSFIVHCEWFAGDLLQRDAFLEVQLSGVDFPATPET